MNFDKFYKILLLFFLFGFFDYNIIMVLLKERLKKFNIRNVIYRWDFRLSCKVVLVGCYLLVIDWFLLFNFFGMCEDFMNVF